MLEIMVAVTGRNGSLGINHMGHGMDRSMERIMDMEPARIAVLEEGVFDVKIMDTVLSVDTEEAGMKMHWRVQYVESGGWVHSLYRSHSWTTNRPDVGRRSRTWMGSSPWSSSWTRRLPASWTGAWFWMIRDGDKPTQVTRTVPGRMPDHFRERRAQ